MKRNVLLTLMMIPMLCIAQSIEVKYSVYSKQRKAQIEKIMSNAANQGNKGLLAGMEAEKRTLSAWLSKTDSLHTCV